MTSTYEVGIVGAGVAGLSCAQILGKAGVKVAIFDHSHPREKPCGGLIEERVISEFNIPKELIENEVKWVLAERFGLRVKLFYEPPMFLISRKNFDYYLLQNVLKSKSVVFFNEAVSRIARRKNNWVLKTKEGGCVNVKVLIGADGCPSLVRKCVFTPIPAKLLRPTVGYNFPCSQKYIQETFPKNTIEVYYSQDCVQKGGFIWIFPKATSINIGVGSLEMGRNLKQSLDKFISSHPAGRRLKVLEGHFFTHLIPTILMAEFFDLPCSSSNWALIGDAAGHVNPIGGAGIYYAMKGGMLCGLAFLDGDLRLFERYWRREYGNELYYGATEVSKFYGHLGFFLWLYHIFRNFLCRSSFTSDRRS